MCVCVQPRMGEFEWGENVFLDIMKISTKNGWRLIRLKWERGGGGFYAYDEISYDGFAARPQKNAV